MRLPSSDYAADTALTSPSPVPYSFFATLRSFGGSRGNTTGDWSSLIGIITAIIGNILISIALNTQRYAHIKLSEQHAERQRLLRRAQRRAERTASGGYGTETSSKPKERARQDGRNEHRVSEDRGVNGIHGRYRDEEEDSEHEPLLASSIHSENSERHSEIDVGEIEVPEDVAHKSYLRSPWWWAGIVMMTIGEAGNFLAYGFAPASIVSPLGVVALISNCIIAPFFLKEKFRRRDLFGVLIAVGGAVTVVLSASDSNPKLGPDEIWHLITTWEFETYLGITIGVIIVLMWTSAKYGGKSIFVDLGLVGLFGGYTALSTKGVASMLSYTLFRALTYPITYLLVFVLVFTAIMQIKYVNRALQRFSSTQVIPTQFVMFTLSVIVGSAVLYRDFEKESGEDASKFIGGCALTFFGVWLITSGRKTEEPDEEEFLDDEEEAIGLVHGQTHDEQLYYDEPETRPKPRRSSTLPGSVLATSNANGLVTSEASSERRRSLESDLEDLPVITRTGTGRSVTFVDDEPFVPASSPGISTIAESPWAELDEHTPKERRSIQNLLKPLSKLFPGQESRPLPNTLKTTHSAPLLPSEAQYHPGPQTPPNSTPQDTDHLTTPQTPDGTLRPPRHHSIVDLIPGPLTSTLSSPLSAIVADSLRRGVDVAFLKPKRRRKLPGMPQRNSLRERGLSEADVRPDRPTISSLPTEESESGEPSTGVRNRVRSLSNTFGDLFRAAKTPTRGSRPDTAATAPSQPSTPSLEESAVTR
ncbi:hypothetical protein BLS_003429 [Venturia inaequalis]|uniref:DUF803-domain-containing protein n=1 Tax=Venturia inaequalis TaxID=5025 RepID=A0A8H3ZCD0_VENIN|nr:hypothetical protein BLS_003429 [Venturia inaequalis]KAE9991058.1 hypothetical protein EG327_000529 [Venturia inaequalis]